MRLITDSAAGSGGTVDAEPARDVAIAQAMLRQVSEGERGPTLRIARPSGPVVAFGRIDRRREGFGRAAAHCRASGFTPVLRAVGGRAAAHTRQAVVVDHVAPESEPGRRMHRRFEDYGRLIASALTGLGVDARVGEVPGEFCPGAYSVNARGVVKLAGTAQRVVRGAWLFSAVIVVDDADRLRSVLPVVYDHLGLATDPAAVGSVAGEVPGVDADVVRDALVRAYAQTTELEPTEPDEELLDRASALLPEHLVP